MKAAFVLCDFLLTIITMFLTGLGQQCKMINGNNKLVDFMNKPTDRPQSVCYPSDSLHNVFKT